ncbi:MAG: kinase [Candidatus Omnitrophica bacterium]|nr:kinase [Candidatus Omnitrophota bacterium]
MVISRTPLRISFFGGGTDYPTWYKENGGAVLSTTIDKYSYISCRSLPPFFEYKHSIVYSRHENVKEISEIDHPSVREVFRFLNIEKGLVVHYDGDLPARSGLGSSSSFTVGLLHSLYALNGKMVTKKKLALEAIEIEQEMIKENVGSQDQVIVSFGGLNKIEFNGNHEIEVRPVIIPKERLNDFKSHLMLFFTGFTRIASEVAKDKITQIPKKNKELKIMHGMVDEAISILSSQCLISDFGKLLHENWLLKKSLSSRVSNGDIDAIYQKAITAGATGGKLLGAGGGGFILFLVKPENQAQVKQALNKLLYVPFNFDTTGSQIIYYSQSGV